MINTVSVIPDITIMVPADGDELRAMLHLVCKTELTGPCAIRFPRASIPRPMETGIEEIEWGRWKQLFTGGDTVIIAVGTMVEMPGLLSHWM